MIAPDEEVFRIVEPTREHIGVDWQRFLVELGAPGRAWNLVDGGFDFDLGQALLRQDTSWLVDARKSEIERQRRLEAVRIAGFREQRLGLGDVGIVLVRLRPGDPVGVSAGAPNMGLASPNSTASMIF